MLERKFSNSLLLEQANDIASNVGLVLGHESIDTLDSKNLYDLASKLEDARNILLTLGDRVMRDERASETVDVTNGVPF